MKLTQYIPKKTFLKSGWGWIGKAKARPYITVLAPGHIPVTTVYSVAKARAYIRKHKNGALL